ncbi:MAG: hypothetical protein ABIC04_02275 [Nanoarchaeota archaeon]
MKSWRLTLLLLVIVSSGGFLSNPDFSIFTAFYLYAITCVITCTPNPYGISLFGICYVGLPVTAYGLSYAIMGQPQYFILLPGFFLLVVGIRFSNFRETTLNILWIGIGSAALGYMLSSFTGIPPYMPMGFSISGAVLVALMVPERRYSFSTGV